MGKIELYFLNYKLNIYLDNLLLKRFSEFWKSFLTKDSQFNITDEWNIHFINSSNTSTQVNYETRQIYHYHNSVCDLTELNNLIRETIVKLSAMDGVVWLHCSGFMLDNKTYLVIGNKGDGKTTMLLNMINKGAKFLGNDQLPIFEHNKKICTYLWRPDIKISMDYAVEMGITNKKQTAKEEKILYLVNNKIPYGFINAKKMSERIRKKITLPDKEMKITMPLNKKNQIDYLIFLDKEQILDEYKENNILNKIKDDQETILAYKLKNMEKYMPYWNKRIKQIKLDKDAYKVNEAIIDELTKQTKKIICGNRMKFDYVWNEINQF
jgi:hypothetical protein